MSGLEELRRKLSPLFDVDVGFSSLSPSDSLNSCVLSGENSVNLLGESLGVYKISERGIHRCTDATFDEAENTYNCAAHEMRVFGAVGCGSSSVVQRAIHIPTHRFMALKNINVFEKEKRKLLLTEIKTFCEASCYEGLVEFHGAFYTPGSGHISIALEYMDGGSLADILRLCSTIPESILALIFDKLLHGLNYLHSVRHLVHRDIKPANLLLNMKGEPKITDFGISSGLNNSEAMCATFVGTVTYMSPERIRNESYSYPADIWSLGLTLFECGTGHFPYSATHGPVDLMLQIMDDVPPSPDSSVFSQDFCSFVDSCLQKNPDRRPTAEQLLSHPFLSKTRDSKIDLSGFVSAVFDPTEKMKNFADMVAIHYYLLFDGSEDLWGHTKSLYRKNSTFCFRGRLWTGEDEIFYAISGIRRRLAGDRPCERVVHMVEKLYCRSDGGEGLVVRASGSLLLAPHSFFCGNGLRADGAPGFDEPPEDVNEIRVGGFQEQFVVMPGDVTGSVFILSQVLYIRKID